MLPRSAPPAPPISQPVSPVAPHEALPQAPEQRVTPVNNPGNLAGLLEQARKAVKAPDA